MGTRASFCIALFLLAGCGGAPAQDYERYKVAFDGIPYFRNDAPHFDEASFEQFAADTCGLDDEALGRLYDNEDEGTSTYMLLAFACGDEVADRALGSSSEDIDSRRYIRAEYQEDWSTIEKARARIAEARATRCPDATNDPTCPGS